jgi:membrane-associated protease RseP (regulator of RpoE activity)
VDDLPTVRPPAPRRGWLHAGLLALTFLTTLEVGATLEGHPSQLSGWHLADLAWGLLMGRPSLEPLALLATGWPYATAVLAILGAHEMGHYVLCRLHGIDATLPYFIPVPFGVGTLGAVMRMRSAPPSRRAVLDVGVAGPLAGLAVALPLLLWGFAHSRVAEAAASAGLDSPWALLLAWREGRLGAALEGGDVQIMGDSLLTWAAQRLVVGPLPAGQELLLHPVAYAAWLGLVITAINLVPFGQLDGGHLTYALLGAERAAWLSRWVSRALLACGLFLSWNWLAWWALTRFVIGPRHPASADDSRLDPLRVAVAVLGLVLFLLTFVPVPFSF